MNQYKITTYQNDIFDSFVGEHHESNSFASVLSHYMNVYGRHLVGVEMVHEAPAAPAEKPLNKIFIYCDGRLVKYEETGLKVKPEYLEFLLARWNENTPGIYVGYINLGGKVTAYTINSADEFVEMPI